MGYEISYVAMNEKDIRTDQLGEHGLSSLRLPEKENVANAIISATCLAFGKHRLCAKMARA